MSGSPALDAFAMFPRRLATAAGSAEGPIPDGEWGPAEVVRHLIAVEREVWQARFADIERDAQPAWGWTEPGPEPGFDDASLGEILAAFAAARGRTVAVVTAFDDEAWARSGTHVTYGVLDVEGLLRLANDHDAEHLASLSPGTAPEPDPTA